MTEGRAAQIAARLRELADDFTNSIHMADDEIAAVREAADLLAALSPAPTETADQWLRFEWWRDHGDAIHGNPDQHCPYGDDGEMQCCAMDFKRMPLELLHQRVKEGRDKRKIRLLSASALSPAPTETGKVKRCAGCGHATDDPSGICGICYEGASALPPVRETTPEPECPTCGSPDTALHPMSNDGREQVRWCDDAWHRSEKVPPAPPVRETTPEPRCSCYLSSTEAGGQTEQTYHCAIHGPAPAPPDLRAQIQAEINWLDERRDAPDITTLGMIQQRLRALLDAQEPQR